MGIQINIGDHTSPIQGWGPFKAPHVDVMKWARARAKSVAQGMPSADRYFMRLPGGRSLRDLLADRSIWLNHDPRMRDYGMTSLDYPHEIAIGQIAFIQGRWMVLATMLHELAHVNGAPDDDGSAELTLVHCGLGRRSEITRGDDPNTPFIPGLKE
jgi:hypothetical protein